MNEKQNLKITRTIQGLILSLAAPIGAIVLRSVQGYDIKIDLIYNTDIYLYIFIYTLIVFTSFGYFIGSNEEKLGELSITDPLTGLYNFSYFNARLDEEYALYVRKKTPLSIVIINLDSFKKINDKFGHATGDRVLVSVSEAIIRVGRKEETITRVSGEEFAIILRDCNSIVAYSVVERCLSAIQSTQVKAKDGTLISVNASAGLASTDSFPDIKSFEELYSKADKALYTSKGSKEQIKVAK